MEILITGAAGIVGTALRRELRERGYTLRLLDLDEPAEVAVDERVFVGSITDPALLREAAAGVGGVLHLAGCTTDAAMDLQIEGNIVGASNVYEAARLNGVQRVVFASSHHVVGYYPRRRRLDANVILRPDSRYGLTKGFGEQLGAFYADKYGMHNLAIRIGFANHEPVDRRRLAIWTSWRDLAQLVDIGFTNPALRFAIVYGVSNNDRSFFDNSAAFTLGYKPEDNAEAFAEEVLKANPPEDESKVGTHVIGGHFANGEFEGSFERIYEW
ncbi:NAD-dependent epimerase/dehydratase family protein [Shinella sp.]|uniref:NAD-dependent epimerase/dehydratase family protein n=1 Tax=Shinella sp. TaxID=1870904 RepID=UPI003F6EBC19